MTVLLIKKLHPDAKIPERAHPTDSGLDLFALNSCAIRPKGSAIVDTGIAIVLPFRCEGQIRPRSGLAFNHDIMCHFGTIDYDYTGPMRIKMFNLSETTFFVEQGMRIAQLVVVPIVRPEVVITEVLPETARGTKGYGSTGV